MNDRDAREDGDTGVERRSTLLETPSRWPYRLEGLVIGFPTSYFYVKAFGPDSLLVMGAIGLIVVIAMQYRRNSR